MASGVGTGVWARVGSAISGLFLGGVYFLGSRHTGRTARITGRFLLLTHFSSCSLSSEVWKFRLI